MCMRTNSQKVCNKQTDGRGGARDTRRRHDTCATLPAPAVSQAKSLRGRTWAEPASLTKAQRGFRNVAMRARVAAAFGDARNRKGDGQGEEEEEGRERGIRAFLSMARKTMTTRDPHECALAGLAESNYLGASCFVFGTDNKFRRTCYEIVSHPIFQNVMSLLILGECKRRDGHAMLHVWCRMRPPCHPPRQLSSPACTHATTCRSSPQPTAPS